MRGYLTSNIDRQLRRLTLGTTIGMAIVATTAVLTGGFHEPRFNQADLAVEKAQVLLGPSLCGTPSEQQTVFCENLVKRAEELLARAREAVTAAQTVVSGGDVAVLRR